jgi:nitroimidazol reductase NimA-like FMN-containing flavoprotein (pyridoxamine 5'-phosphate oxidase superfamily)
MPSELSPTAEKNLAELYDLPPLEWERVRERLEHEWALAGPNDPDNPHTHWLVTVRPDGRPHVTGIGAAWSDGTFYFTSGPGTQKSKNLAQNPHCSIALAAKGIDIVLEGEAALVTDDATLHRLAAVFASSGWSPEVRDGAFYYEYSAPSAGPPPWQLYELTPHTVYGLASEEPHGATRWRVQRETT